MAKWLRWLIMLAVMPLSVLAIQIKDTAPDVYIVKKGDTLWDISSMYLEKPWQWPELWRNNTFLTNPHLIYPGDELRLRVNEQGEPELEIVREPEVLKPLVKLSPQGRKVFKPEPIATIPWSVIESFVNNDFLLSDEEFQALPIVLGDPDGGIRFASGDLIISDKIDSAGNDYVIVRKQNQLMDMDDELLGWQVRNVADVEVIPADTGSTSVVKVKASNFEANRGDRIMPAPPMHTDKVLGLVPANQQRGHVIGSVENHTLMGKYDVVALDMGSSDVVPGTVFGIYKQGPAIKRDDKPQYVDDGNKTDKLISTITSDTEQPALKIGEVVVFKVFDNSSYALIIKANQSVKRGAIVAKP
ncbi:LysM peptidoglycan-binding domain-containing protein [Bowmanella sp. JS7-9]|uniref:LysM peptidoglycan-binding domain-containing protein n=1 Tax=Alteromonadaceae TaxID=72275 RepID=UPI00103CAC21|nr:LysM domain-containing protein [Bowmanella sp. JS7-9]TBX24375.1 peptidoglycan-binding protein [Bowmanella sp. JS7-9]